MKLCRDNDINVPIIPGLKPLSTAKHLNVTEDETILELGCGCGRIADNMSNITNCNGSIFYLKRD